jgi:hypothetical protein
MKDYRCYSSLPEHNQTGEAGCLIKIEHLALGKVGRSSRTSSSRSLRTTGEGLTQKDCRVDHDLDSDHPHNPHEQDRFPAEPCELAIVVSVPNLNLRELECPRSVVQNYI